MAELQQLPKHYQRYRIDVHLKRFEKALWNLSMAGDSHFEELLTFTQKYRLFPLALHVQQDGEKARQLYAVYGDVLFEDHHYADAYLAWKHAGMYAEAMEACKLAGMWKELFSLAHMCRLSSDDVQVKALEMMQMLREVCCNTCL